jgi:antitoxin (DNA-binding transcriptional repressor) of toxin-antitoxin stability system
MKTIQFTEFRKQASEIMTAIEQGETYIIIRHGRAIAEISPIPVQKPAWKQQALRLTSSGVSLSAAILGEREDETLS